MGHGTCKAGRMGKYGEKGEKEGDGEGGDEGGEGNGRNNLFIMSSADLV